MSEEHPKNAVELPDFEQVMSTQAPCLKSASTPTDVAPSSRETHDSGAADVRQSAPKCGTISGHIKPGASQIPRTNRSLRGHPMTRKQAIEAAYDAYEESGTVHAGLQSAYDAGRIAGLREAARTKHEDRDRTDRNFDWDRPWNDGHDSHAEAIRAHARELAKKVKEGR